MRKKSIRPVVFIVLLSFLFTSCASLPPPGTALTADERESAKEQCIAQYTAVGAVGGAIIGGLLGSRGVKTEGALIGAAAGGALAFAIAWGHCLSVYSNLNSYPMADARATASRVGYHSSQGSVVKIENFSLNPDGVSPGGRIKMNGSYYVMAPEGNKEVKVIETRVVSYFDSSANEWKELGSVDQDLTASLGTRRAEGVFDMPADVPEGNYRITLKIASQGREDRMTRDLKVKKGLAMGPDIKRELPSQPSASGRSFAQAGQGEKSVENPASDKAVIVEVTSKALNVRTEPSSKAKLLAEIRKGETYRVLDSTGGTDKDKWFKIRIDNGEDGWVPGKHVKIRDN